MASALGDARLEKIMTNRSIRKLATSFVIAAVCWPAAGVSPVRGGPPEDWPQWGGPRRDFKLAPKDLAETWADSGPPRLWSRELGEGHSSILAVAGKLYTMYRKEGQEIVVCLEAATGKTLWEFAYDAPTGEMNITRGAGPHGTPLIVGDRIFSVGATGKLHALSKADGSPIWSHDLMRDFQGTFRNRGYSASPVAYGDTVIVPVGGKGRALVAFRQSDGSVAWKGGDFENGHASPILVDVDGQDQLLALLAADVAGFDPRTGELLWSHPHYTNRSGLSISPPVWGDDHVVVVSSAYDGGSRALKLTRKDGATTVEELWSHRKMRVHFTSMMRLGDHVYGSSGDFGPSFLTGVNVHTGEVAWRDRAFPKASFFAVGDRSILLDEDGNLALVTFSPEGLQVHARAKVCEGLSWTTPTLVGTTLYIRNTRMIMALDLRPTEGGR
jgi:outer membrane protein assembly factor BamB